MSRAAQFTTASAIGALSLIFSPFAAAPVNASKGDRLPRSQSANQALDAAPHEGRYEIRFSPSYNGLWTYDPPTCDALTNIDSAPSGSAIALFRGLLEVPGLQCQIYRSTFTDNGERQTADMRCIDDTEVESVTSVTVTPADGDKLRRISVKIASSQPQIFEFCREITKPLSAW